MRRHSELWDVARRMPPRMHSFPGEEFDWMESEAALWLVNQPEIRKLVFEAVKGHGSIVFDPKTRMWKGVDW